MNGEGRIVRPVLRTGTVTSSSIDIEWDGDAAATGWRVRQLPGHGRYLPTGHPYWHAAGLKPGTLYEFWVFAVDDDHAEWSERTIIRVSTIG